MGLGTEIKVSESISEIWRSNFHNSNLRLIQANRALRLRATLGGKRLQTDLGIGIEGRLQTAAETLRYEDQRSVSVTLLHTAIWTWMRKPKEAPITERTPPVRLAPRIVVGEVRIPRTIRSFGSFLPIKSARLSFSPTLLNSRRRGHRGGQGCEGPWILRHGPCLRLGRIPYAYSIGPVEKSAGYGSFGK